MAENFLNLARDISLQIQEVGGNLKRVKVKKYMLRYTS